MTVSQSPLQMRSAAALKIVAYVRGTGDDVSPLARQFRQAIKEFPSLIRINGLGLAVAQFCARAMKASERKGGLETCVGALQLWLNSQEHLNIQGELLPAICACDRRTYYAAQAEALAYLESLKTIAMGSIPPEPDQAGLDREDPDEDGDGGDD